VQWQYLSSAEGYVGGNARGDVEADAAVAVVLSTEARMTHARSHSANSERGERRPPTERRIPGWERGEAKGEGKVLD